MTRIREIANGLQFPEGPVAMADGSVILVEIARGTLSRVTPDGRVSVVAALGGGPNGAAIGPDGAMYVCNNGGFRWMHDSAGLLRPVAQADDYSGGRIERVDLASGRFERVLDNVAGQPLRGPNDLVFAADGGFYFTDLGKTREREMDRGGVFFARPDGSASVVARPAMTPNGTALSPDDRTLYYAETEGARLWAFDLDGPGRIRPAPWPSPQGARMLCAAPGGQFQRFDSIAVDAFGNILVATLMHGGLTVVSPDGRLVTHVPLPDAMTTNCCFGGPDLRTLYVTLSGTGKLVAIDDWPTPGLRLHFNG
ncbi:MAG: SMP-30/gluconolactonase/LRE family protein [Aquabacterium sp.]